MIFLQNISDKVKDKTDTVIVKVIVEAVYFYSKFFIFLFLILLFFSTKHTTEIVNKTHCEPKTTLNRTLL